MDRSYQGTKKCRVLSMTGKGASLPTGKRRLFYFDKGGIQSLKAGSEWFDWNSIKNIHYKGVKNEQNL